MIPGIKVFSTKKTKVGYLQIIEAHLTLPGLKKPIDRTFVLSKAAVAALVYNKRRDTFLFVEQCRIATLETQESPFLLEVAAGIHDQLTVEDTLHKEMEEELGISPKIYELTPCGQYFSTPGMSSEMYHLFYAVVDIKEKLAPVGGLVAEGELLKRHEIPVKVVLELLRNQKIYDAKTALLINWWLVNIADQETSNWYRSLP